MLVKFAPIIVQFFSFNLRFSLRFLDIVGDHGLRRVCLQFIRASYHFLLYFCRRFDTETHGDRTVVVGSPQILSGNRTEPVRCPYGVPRRSNPRRSNTKRKAIVR